MAADMKHLSHMAWLEYKRQHSFAFRAVETRAQAKISRVAGSSAVQSNDTAPFTSLPNDVLERILQNAQQDTTVQSIANLRQTSKHSSRVPQLCRGYGYNDTPHRSCVWQRVHKRNGEPCLKCVDDTYVQHRVLKGHTDEVNCVVQLKPKSGELASASKDGMIKLWNMYTGECMSTREAHDDRITSLLQLRSGQLASASIDGTIRLWDPKTLEPMAPYKIDLSCKPYAGVIELASGQLAAGGLDRDICLWDLQEDAGEAATRLPHPDHVMCFVQLASTELASGLMNGTITIWDLTTGDPLILRTLTGHQIPNAPQPIVMCLVQLESGQLASGDSDGTIRLWNPETSKETAPAIELSHPVLCITQLASGHLASGHSDSTIRLFEVGPNACDLKATLHDTEPPLNSSKAVLSVLQLSSPGEFVSCWGNGNILIWSHPILSLSV